MIAPQLLEGDHGSSSLTVKGLIEVGISGPSLFNVLIEQVLALAASLAPWAVIEASEGSEHGCRVAITVEAILHRLMGKGTA